ncbi:FlaG/FlaF family flagellin (archaellin) [Methanomicrobium sp. W14]|uniref:type IV pilin N-terminal domain-containing protein n=1 Tax=Methanomicrobium sp. W14 TaxID=2817839 RepID=UPI001AE565A7|nr:type IV pilin N-terminal domain-containing protein [Methanomicrobium sp. W14]MBP2133135.1 FlaG/FlaF family flagellin (archaellin) [Methanomicrobium sp. W14]
MKLKFIKSKIGKNILKDDFGVSPVIGVMLMLVVTIIIASFVAVFAGGAAGSATAVPSASLDVSIISNGGDGDDQYVMLIKHLGGDSIPSSDMQILTYYTSPSTCDKGKQMLGGSISSVTSAISAAKLSYSDQDVKIPFLNNLAIGKPGDPGTNFGEYTFGPGDVISTGDDFGTAVAVFGITTTSEINSSTYSGYGFGRGSSVEVEVIHNPSQKSIYKGTVTVE